MMYGFLTLFLCNYILKGKDSTLLPSRPRCYVYLLVTGKRVVAYFESKKDAKRYKAFIKKRYGKTLGAVKILRREGVSFKDLLRKNPLPYLKACQKAP